MLSYYLSNLARKHWQREGGFKACILYSSSMGCDVFARLPQTDERRMVSSTTTTVKLLCKRWQQLKRKACNYLRSIAPPRRRIAPRGRGWAEQRYEQQGGVDGGSIMVQLHILSRWYKHYCTTIHILSRGCKQVEWGNSFANMQFWQSLLFLGDFQWFALSQSKTNWGKKLKLVSSWSGQINRWPCHSVSGLVSQVLISASAELA